MVFLCRTGTPCSFIHPPIIQHDANLARLYIWTFFKIPCKHRNDIDACKFVYTPALCIRIYIYTYIHHSLYSYTFPMVYPFQYRVYICIHEVRRIGTWLVDSQKEPKHRRSHSQPTMLKRHFLVTSSNLTLKVTANG